MSDVVTEVAPSAPASSPAPAAPAAPASAPEISLEDDLGRVWDKAQEAREAESEDKPAAPAVKRGPDGKFVSDKPLPPAPLQDGSKPAELAKVEGEKPAEVSATAVDAPKWWAQDLQEKFKTLAPEVAKAIGEQALNDRQTISRLGHALNTYEPIGQVLQHFKGEFEKHGIAPAQGIAQLLQAQQRLDNPATRIDAFRQLAQMYQIDLGQLADPLAQALPSDPQIEALRAELRDLKQESSRRAAAEQAWAQRQQESERQQRLSVIDKVAQGKPHFEAVANDVLAMIPVIRNANPGWTDEAVLTHAYESAVWANPKTRAALQQAEVDKQLAAKAQAAAQAKRANGINVSTKQRASTATDLEDDLGRVWDKHYN